MSPVPRRRRLEVEDIGEVTVVNFMDKKILDEQNIQTIGEQLFALVDLGKTKILLNFANVEYLSSATIGKLITLSKKVENVSDKLVFCNLDPGIYETFEGNKLFRIVRDENVALDIFSSPEG